MRGRNPDIDSTGARAAPADLWPAPGDVLSYPFPASPLQLEVVSTDANDTFGGTGARLAYVTGLDADWNPVLAPEIIPLAGLTPVPMPSGVSYIRRTSFMVIAAGSGQRNAGDIILRGQSGGPVLGIIPAGLGIDQSAAQSIANGFEASIIDTFVGLQRQAAGWAEVGIEIRDGRQSGAWLMVASATVNASQTFVQATPRAIGASIKAGWDIRLICLSVSGSNIVVSGLMQLAYR